MRRVGVWNLTVDKSGRGGRGGVSGTGWRLPDSGCRRRRASSSFGLRARRLGMLGAGFGPGLGFPEVDVDSGWGPVPTAAPAGGVEDDMTFAVSV